MMFRLAVVIVASFFLWMLYIEKQDWEQFKINHDCKILKITEEVQPWSGSTTGILLGFTIPGNVTTWSCSDGKTYVR